MTKQFFDRTGAVSLSKPLDVDANRRLVPLDASPPSEREAEVALRS